MTILETITQILSSEGQGLSCKEITNRIVSQNLYTFNTADPNSIVRQCLRRHCQGLDFASAYPVKHFYILSGNRGSAVYALLDNASEEPAQNTNSLPTSSSAELLPEERMQQFYKEHRKMVKEQLLDMILYNDPRFFEHLVVKLLLALGYGYGTEAGKVVGKSHDGGIDGIINEDKLGLDKIYVQAKRYIPRKHVGSKEVQAFAGAMKKVRKGVFITTSRFTASAQKEAREQEGKQIALIDGEMLTDLMLRCGIGIRKVQTFDTYEIDTEFFGIL